MINQYHITHIYKHIHPYIYTYINISFFFPFDMPLIGQNPILLYPLSLLRAIFKFSLSSSSSSGSYLPIQKATELKTLINP